MSTFYKTAQSDAMDIARLKLALFDERTVRDIIALVAVRGSALISDIYGNPQAGDPPRVLSVLSPDYIRYSDQPEIISGIATVLTAALRSPKSRDDYAGLLTDAYGIPKPMANAYADKIETLDKITASGNLLSNTSGVMSAWKDKADEWVRSMANRISNAVGAGSAFYWDQDQDRDVDYLFELSRLGEITQELEKRRRLISGQAGVSANLEMLQLGDVDDDSSSEDAEDAMLGDVVRRMALRTPPPSNTPGHIALNQAADKALLGDIQCLTGAPTPEDAVKPEYQGILKKKIDRASGKKGFLSSLFGIGFPRIKALRDALNANDSDAVAKDEAMGDVLEHFGPKIHAQLLTGDVEGLIGDAFRLAMEEDPEMWGDVDGQSTEYDESDDPEIGGLFSRWRERSAAKKLARRTRRAERKGARFTAKQLRKDNRLANKMAARAVMPSYANSGQFAPQQPAYQEQYPTYMDQGQDFGYDPNFTDNYDSLFPSEDYQWVM